MGKHVAVAVVRCTPASEHLATELRACPRDQPRAICKPRSVAGDHPGALTGVDSGHLERIAPAAVASGWSTRTFVADVRVVLLAPPAVDHEVAAVDHEVGVVLLAPPSGSGVRLPTSLDIASVRRPTPAASFM